MATNQRTQKAQELLLAVYREGLKAGAKIGIQNVVSDPEPPRQLSEERKRQIQELEECCNREGDDFGVPFDPSEAEEQAREAEHAARFSEACAEYEALCAAGFPLSASSPLEYAEHQMYFHDRAEEDRRL